MTYRSELRALAARVAAVLAGYEVEPEYLQFGGALPVPKPIRGPTASESKFRAEQALGDWAEDTLAAAINRNRSPYRASPYGWNAKTLAGDPGFAEEYARGVRETCQFGKKADLLIFRSHEVPVADLREMAGEQLKALIKPAVLAIEVRSSRMKAQAYIAYHAKREAERHRRAPREPTVPSFTVKVEDLLKVFRWIELNNKRQAYAQVFLDEVHAINFKDIMEYISTAPSLTVETYKRSRKTTIMIPITQGQKIGDLVEFPDFQTEVELRPNGRYDIFARPIGGRIRLVPRALDFLID